VQSPRRLTSRQQAEVLGLVRNATRVDKVAPLSEQVLLSVREGAAGAGPGPATGSRHLLAYDGMQLAGYAHLEGGGDDAAATAELVVDPSSRRRGVGASLVHGLEAARSAGWADGRTLRLWSHGDLGPARAFALHGGYSTVRELWQMRRSLRPDAAPLPDISLPGGFRTRHFVVGRDEEAWLRLNALAFVGHPEQGRMTRHDLDRRIALEWFDASGFILVEDTRGPGPVLVASHWTKVVPPADGGDEPAVPPAEGEVYVVGVNPAYQGLGLGRAVTVLGLEHLRDKGLSEAMLYVDADNVAAVATYAGLDFVRSAVDIMYERIVHPPMGGWGHERARIRGSAAGR
jgi:mycothiol synthase